MNFSLMTCRDPKACPGIPEPTEESNLKTVPESVTITDGVPQDTLEHTIFEFLCKDEFTLAGVMHDLIEDTKVKVPCRITNGTLVTPEDWPQCLPIAEKCSEIPTEFENIITNLTSLPVDKDESATFTCLNSGKIHL